MLEDWAWWYVAHSELQLKLFSIGWLVLGGVVAAVLHRGESTLGRGAFFAASGLVVLAIAASQGVWLLAGQAMQGGWLFAVIAADAGLSAVWGYVLVALGQARSRDAFGHGKAGIASLVPVANLWLVFAPPVEPRPRSGGSAALVVVGLVAILASRVAESHLAPMIEAGVIAVGEDPALASRFVDLQFATASPEELLRAIASQTQEPQSFDGGVSLMKVAADGLVMTYVYHLLELGAEIDAMTIEDTRRTICVDPVFQRLLDRGARVEFVYFSADGTGAFSETARFSAAAKDCRI